MNKINSEKFKEMIKEEASYWDKYAKRELSQCDFFGIWQDTIANEIFYGDVLEECYQQAYKCGGRILELGCGEGKDSIQLAKYGNTVDAIDLSAESIKVARSNYNKIKEEKKDLGNINFIIGDLNRITFGENKYDCVFAKSSLYLVVYLENLMKELKQALKPGGYFIVLDSIGMKKIIMLLAKTLVFILPTTRSYRDKFKFEGKFATLKMLLFPGLLQRKKTACGTAFAWKSPFAFASRTKKLIEVIGNYFTIQDIKYFNFIMHYLIPRLKLPTRYKKEICLYSKNLDKFVIKMFPWLGEMARIFAINTK